MNLSSGKKIGGTFRGDPVALGDVGVVHDFLRKLIEEIGMNALGFHVYDVPIHLKRQNIAADSDEGGVTGLAVLSTSHVAIHTWPLEAAASFDLHSCRDFDAEKVTALLREFFNAVDLSCHDLSFSLHGGSTWPTELRSAASTTL